MATWLDTTFAGFDAAVSGFAHRLAEATGGALNTPMELISLLAWKGLCMFLLGLILCLFAKTRKTGATAFLAVCFGALITNIILKDLVARPRPFEASETYRAWWEYAGAVLEDEFSFPSGHTTSATAAMAGLFLASGKKKRTWPVLLLIPVIGFSRIYLTVHYPTDVLGGVVAGVCGAVIACFLVKGIYALLTAHECNRFCAFCLTFDPVVALWRKLRGQKEAATEGAPTAEDTTAAGGATTAGDAADTQEKEH